MLIANIQNLTPGSKKYVEIECDFHISPRCKNRYSKSYNDVTKNRKNNGGKDICFFCSRILKTHRTFDINQSIFDPVDTDQKAYILGLIASDGTIKTNGVITIELERGDAYILDYVANSICNDITVKYRRNRNTAYVNICSKKVTSDVCRHLGLSGPGKKSRTVRMPQLGYDLTCAFLRGFFDGDGHIRPWEKRTKKMSMQCSIRSNSSGMLSDIVDFFTLDRRGRGDELVLCGEKAMFFLSQIYGGDGVCLFRKKNQFTKWLWYRSLAYRDKRKVNTELGNRYGIDL